MGSSIEKLLGTQKLILVCGSGGVGKTTLSAALALKAALSGRKTAVLTIDPAKRLATSMGLENLTGRPSRVAPELLQQVGGTKSDQLYAMMLNTKSTFDALIEKYAPDAQTRDRILSNKIYQHLSLMMAGSQEYMAIEKLQEFMASHEFDLVVVDTPPTVHAIDFLNAPGRMVDALDHSMLHLLLKPALFVGKSGFGLMEKATRMIFKVMDRVTGMAFLEDVSGMLMAFEKLLGGFRDRAKEARAIMEDESTSFVLIGACEDKSVGEVELFSKKLRELKLNWEGMVVNRVHPDFSFSSKRQEEDLGLLEKEVGENLASKMMKLLESNHAFAKRDKAYLTRFKALLNEDQFLVSIPMFESDIHDLKGLKALTQYF